MATMDRLSFVEALAERYKGPISLTYPVSATNLTARQAALDALDRLYSNSIAMQNVLDIHLVIDDRETRLNTWRNVARSHIKSSYAMMLDADFWTSPNLLQVLQEPGLLRRLERGDEAFVIPCFFVYDEELANAPERFPATKEVMFYLFRSPLVAFILIMLIYATRICLTLCAGI
jgi:hypothetical protein